MKDVRITHVGGPTALIEVGGWRLLTDPTFDPPGGTYRFGWGTGSRKVAGPAIAPADLPPIDAVLLSHDHHGDNLDPAGRSLLPSAGVIVTTVAGAQRLGSAARGLEPWATTRLEAPGRPSIEITATPCRHGPPLSRPIVGHVIGFALTWEGQEHGVLWISGDTVLYRPRPPEHRHPDPLRGLEALPGRARGHRARACRCPRGHRRAFPVAADRRRGRSGRVGPSREQEGSDRPVGAMPNPARPAQHRSHSRSTKGGVVTAEGGPEDAGVDERVPPPGRRAHRRVWPAARAWLIGLRASRSYAFVLVLVVVAFVFTAAAPDERWAHGVLVLIESITLLIALWTSRAAPIGLRIVIPAVAFGVAVAQLVHEDEALTGASGVLGGLLVTATIVVIARGVVSHGEVDAQSVIGAITVYVLLGMLFVFAYTVVAVIGDGSFFAQGTDGTVALRLYFSFTTLTTVGYGDYTAASDLGHTLGVTEALVGQVYLVTVVAILVSRMTPRGTRRRGGGEGV